MYIPEYFTIEELVPPELIAEAGSHKNILWMLFDVRALQTLDMLRRRYGKTTVNNWRSGGHFRHSGWRPWECSEGAQYSQHKMGRAFDCKFAEVTAEEVRQDLLKKPDSEPFKFIHRIEAFEGMSWFHFDTGNHLRKNSGIRVVGR